MTGYFAQCLRDLLAQDTLRVNSSQQISEVNVKLHEDLILYLRTSPPGVSYGGVQPVAQDGYECGPTKMVNLLETL